MKTCTKCNILKEFCEFRWRDKSKNLLQTWCKSCFSLHERCVWRTDSDRRVRNLQSNNTRKLRNAQYVWDILKSKGCKICGETDPVVLEFDHVDAKTKLSNISELSRRSYSKEKINDEIAKCDVLCANCHRRKTATQFSWYKNIKTGE